MASFGQAFDQGMANRRRAANTADALAYFDADTRRISALSGGGGGGGAPAPSAPSFDAGPYGHAAMNAAYDKNIAPKFAGLGAAKTAQQSGAVGQTQGVMPGSGNTFAQQSGQGVGVNTNAPWTPSGLNPLHQPTTSAKPKVRRPSQPYAQQPLGELTGQTVMSSSQSGVTDTALGLSVGRDSAFPSAQDPNSVSTPDASTPWVVREPMRRGKTFVKDKTGNGNPKKDTVDAKLAEGEAVLNAGAAELLGRDKIAALNEQGAKQLGLRGGAQMKDGVLHAVSGWVVPEDVMEKVRSTPGAKVLNQIDQLKMDAQARSGSLPPTTGEIKVRPLGGKAGQAAMNKYFPEATNTITPQELKASLENRQTKERLLSKADDVMRRSDALYKAGQATPLQTPFEAAPKMVRNPGLSPKVAGIPYDDLLNAGDKLKKLIPTGLASKAKSLIPGPVAGTAFAPVWAMGGGREEAEAGSGINNNELFGGTRGAYMSGVNKASQNMRDGEYLKAAGNTARAAMDTTQGFADDVLVKPMAYVGQAMASPFRRSGGGGQAQSVPAQAAPASAQVAQPVQVQPTPEQVAAQASQQRTLRDNAAYSEFFNSRGITDEMRQNAATPKWNAKPIGHDKPGIWNMRDVANITDGDAQIYKTVDKDGNVTYTGGGSQSKAADDLARANDPAVKKEAMLEGLRQQAMAGSKEAAAMFQQIVQADTALEVERMRGTSGLEQAKVTAGAKAKEGKDENLSVADQIKLAEVDPASPVTKLMRGFDERKRGAASQLLEVFNDPASTPEQRAQAQALWAQIEKGSRNQDNKHATDMYNSVKDAAASETAGEQALQFGGIGGATAAGLRLLLSRGKDKKALGTIADAAKYFAGVGIPAGIAGWKYGGGSQGVDENTDLFDIESAQLDKNGDLVSGGMVIPKGLLTPQMSRAYEQRTLRNQQ